MNRREMFRILPVSMAGIAGLAHTAAAGENTGDRAGNAPSPAPLAQRYLEKARDMLTWIRKTQAEDLLEGGHAIARTVKNKGQCWASWDVGHSITADFFPERNGEPEIFKFGYDPKLSKQGDLLLASIFAGPHDDLAAKDIFVIGAPVPWSLDAKNPELITYPSAKHSLRPYSTIWIETQLTTLGGIMQLPGIPHPIGPVSGLIGMITFWMMAADACRVLARDGISLPVKGDEPKIGDRVPKADLDAPLLDDYFDEVMRQLEMIGMEMGNIREIARMAVDTALSGGKVYVYSRYYEALAVEALGRRGGPALTQAVWDGRKGFKAGPKDMVIMGTYKPDDEADLRNLDLFKSMGMKLASIGPITRDTRIPEGRAVYKETEVHAGRMTDTYGLFALPGFEQRICPTSGPVVNQIFWATAMEMTDQIIARTGNVPAFHTSAAVKGGLEVSRRVQTIYRERGY
jgi:uncharacterized phosphosugar-binding protein